MVDKPIVCVCSKGTEAVNVSVDEAVRVASLDTLCVSDCVEVIEMLLVWTADSDEDDEGENAVVRDTVLELGAVDEHDDRSDAV